MVVNRPTRKPPQAPVLNADYMRSPVPRESRQPLGKTHILLCFNSISLYSSLKWLFPWKHYLLIVSQVGVLLHTSELDKIRLCT